MHRLSKLLALQLHTAEGPFGTIVDLCLEQRSWALRYLVADIGSWLPGRKILVSPTTVGVPDWGNNQLPIRMNRFEATNSPYFDTDEPLTRQREEQLVIYHGWPKYWTSAAGPDVAHLDESDAIAEGSHNGPVVSSEANCSNLPAQNGGPRCQSVHKLAGCPIIARDGAAGHVVDLLTDTESWKILFLLVDTGTRFSGKTVVLRISAVSDVVTETGQISVERSKQQIESAPCFPETE